MIDAVKLGLITVKHGGQNAAGSSPARGLCGRQRNRSLCKTHPQTNEKIVSKKLVPKIGNSLVSRKSALEFQNHVSSLCGTCVSLPCNPGFNMENFHLKMAWRKVKHATTASQATFKMDNCQTDCRFMQVYRFQLDHKPRKGTTCELFQTKNVFHKETRVWQI